METGILRQQRRCHHVVRLTVLDSAYDVILHVGPRLGLPLPDSCLICGVLRMLLQQCRVLAEQEAAPSILAKGVRVVNLPLVKDPATTGGEHDEMSLALLQAVQCTRHVISVI